MGLDGLDMGLKDVFSSSSVVGSTGVTPEAFAAALPLAFAFALALPLGFEGGEPPHNGGPKRFITPKSGSQEHICL